MIWHGGALPNIILTCMLSQDKLQPGCAVAARWPGEPASQLPSQCLQNTTDRLCRVTSGSQVTGLPVMVGNSGLK